MVNILHHIIHIITRYIFLLNIFIYSVAVYCLRAKAKASKEMLHILSDMLLMHSQDKQFLIKTLAKYANERKNHVFVVIYTNCVTYINANAFSYQHIYVYFLILGALDHSEINFIRHNRDTEQDQRSQKNLLHLRRNLPSTSFELQ